MTQEVSPNVTPNAAPNAAPDVAPAGTDLQGSPAPGGVLPMLDRSQFQEPTAGPQVGDALLEGNPENAHPDPVEPEDLPVDESAETGSLEEMIGHELMQDPGASLVANSLMRLMQGADHNRAFAKALEYNDTRFIDTTYLNEKLGPEVAQEAIRAAEYLANYADNKAAEMRGKLFSAVEGGEEALQLAAKHFRSVAPAAEQRAIARMLDSGDMEIMQYAVQTLAQYGQKLPQGAVQPQARHIVAPTGLQPLSRAEFGRAVLNNPNMSEQEYNALSARLQAGMQPRR